MDMSRLEGKLHNARPKSTPVTTLNPLPARRAQSKRRVQCCPGWITTRGTIAVIGVIEVWQKLGCIQYQAPQFQARDSSSVRRQATAHV